MSLHGIRVALRSLARQPGYTLVALITLVLGIGANTAVFSIVGGVLLSPLPYPAPDRLVRLAEVNGQSDTMWVAWHNFDDWRRSATRFESMAVFFRGGESTVLGTSEPLRAGVTGVSDGFFRTLRAVPERGRALRPEDHRFGAAPVVVVSDAFWRAHLGADPDLAAHPLTVSGFRVQVVGVMPPGFDFPGDIQIWYPVELRQPSADRTTHNYIAIGRLKPGATLAQADGELDAITRHFADEPGALSDPGEDAYFPRAAAVSPLRDTIVGDVQRPLWILLGAALLVLLVACTNLASATLARGTSREHELAVRHALGAGWRRLIGVVVAEVGALSVAGALLGIGAGWIVVRTLPALAPPGLPRLDAIRLDFRVVVFTLVVALVAAVVAGLLPGLRVARGAVASLRGGARGGTDRRRQRIWKWLIGCETALALVLLVGSGLLLRSFRSVLDVDPGFRTSGLLTATVDPPTARYPDDEAKRRYFEALSERLRALPGVEAAGLVTMAPMDRPSNGKVEVQGGPQPTASGEYQLADADYFRVMRIPLLRGRLFEPRDVAGAAHVVVVNHAFAELAWPGEDPIGKQMTGGGMDSFWNQDKWATVVGVVGDVRQSDLTAAPAPTFYFPYTQRPTRAFSMTAVLQPARGRPEALAPAVRQAVHDLDSDVPVRFEPLRQRIGQALGTRRFLLLVVLGFAAIALALAAVGVYGVVAYAVARRRREIGIRLALGATPRALRGALQREYMVAAGFGAAAGVVLALALTRIMENLLFGVRPTDPLTFAGVLAVLGTAAWAASFVSSLRGTRVEPRETLGAE